MEENDVGLLQGLKLQGMEDARPRLVHSQPRVFPV